MTAVRREAERRTIRPVGLDLAPCDQNALFPQLSSPARRARAGWRRAVLTTANSGVRPVAIPHPPALHFPTRKSGNADRNRTVVEVLRRTAHQSAMPRRS